MTTRQRKTASPLPARKGNAFQGVSTVGEKRFSFAPQRKKKMSVETELHIVKRLQALLPVLTAEEKTQLEANLKRDKEKFTPIVFWNDGEKDVIVDGMHSWPIVKKHGLHYTTKELTFADYDEVEIWILEHALGTRGLSPQAQKILRGTLYNKLKQSQGRPAGDTTEKSTQSEGFSEEPEKTAEKVAKQTGVSRATIERDGAYVAALEKVPKSIRDAISSGKIKPASDELKRLASVTEDDQVAVARSLRVGQSQTLAEALTKCGITKSPPKQRTKTAKTSPAKPKDASELLDQLKQVVPAKFRKFFEDTWYDDAYSTLMDIAKEAKKRTTNHYLDRDLLTEPVEQAARKAMDAKPAVICPACDGEGCEWCMLAGWMPAHVHRNYKAKMKARS